MKTIDELLQPGQVVRLYFQENNRNNALYHIRAVVDEKWVVYRKWSKRKQSWQYNLCDRGYLELLYSHHELSDGTRPRTIDPDWV